MDLQGAIALWRDELGDIKTTLHPDGKRWKDAQFREWVNQARITIFNRRPQWYQKTVVLKLSAGAVQNTCDCNKFYAIDGVSDVNGNVIAPLVKQVSKSALFFPPKNCKPCKDANGNDIDQNAPVAPNACVLPKSYSFDPNIVGRFIVDPPIGANCEYYVRAVCANPPDACCDNTCCFGIEEWPVIQWYVKAMAHATLKESVTSAGMSANYLKLFYQILGMQVRADKEYYSQKATTET